VRIQEGAHSSVIDARVALGLFIESGMPLDGIKSMLQPKYESGEKGLPADLSKA